MQSQPTRFIGFLCALFGVILVLVWAPADSGSWFVERARGNHGIGDAMAPAFAGMMFLIAGTALVIFDARADDPGLDRFDAAFIIAALSIVLTGLVCVRYAGPLAANLVGDEYRHLRDTAPWKYTGFGIGGFFIVTMLVTWVEGRFSWRAAATGCAAVLLIIALYDLPFEDLLLPPNGDV